MAICCMSAATWTGETGVAETGIAETWASTLLTRHALRAHRHREQQWFLRHNDPGDRIGNQSNPCHERCNQPHQAHYSHVNVEIFGETQADARNLAPLLGPHETLARHRRSYSNPAIGTDRRVVLNHFAAVVAVHESALPKM